MALAGWQFGQDIESPGNWDESERIRAIMALQGQKVGTWSAPDENGVRHLDAGPLGKLTNAQQAAELSREFGLDGNPYGKNDARWDGMQVNQFHKNGKGKDALQIWIDKDGVVRSAGMDRQSNRDSLATAAGILALGVGGMYAGGGFAGAGSGAATGGTTAGGGLVGGTGGGTAAMSAGELAAMDAAGGAMAGTGVGGGAGITATQAAGAASSGSGLMGGGGGGSGGGMSSASDWFSRLFGGNSGQQLLGGLLGGIGQGYMQHEQMEQAERLLDRRFDHERQMVEAERQWKARNYAPGSMPKVTWNG